MNNHDNTESKQIQQGASALNYACRFRDEARYSVCPIRRDGSKAPALEWKEFQRRFPTDAELSNWFGGSRPYGIGRIEGAISGNAETLDIDLGAWWPEMLRRGVEAVPAMANAPVVQSPRTDGGTHWSYRCIDPVPGNLRLAHYPDPDKPGNFKVGIETRGEGGYCVTIGSPLECHPDHRPYRLIANSFLNVPVLTAEERAILHAIALEFDQRPPVGDQHHQHRTGGTASGDRPGDRFNIYATWPALLEPHGWRCVGSKGGIVFWCRAGKAKGISATENYGGYGLLYNFSSNAAPFELNRAYTKFAALTLLCFGGDFHRAAKAVAGGIR